MKPTLGEAIESVLAQTRLDFHLLVVDSGQWRGRDDDISRKIAQTWRCYRLHPLIEWRETGEHPDLRLHKCPVAWATNMAFRSWLRGRYVATFYDDDLYYPSFVEKMAGYLDEHPEAAAVWCSQDRLRLAADGTISKLGEIRADAPKSGGWDCAVDGGQVMFRRSVLDFIGDPWMSEEPSSCSHSDGLFLERLGEVAGIVPNIPETLLAHRFTPWSTYTR